MTCFSQYDKCLITPFYDFIGPDEQDALTMPGEVYSLSYFFRVLKVSAYSV